MCVFFFFFGVAAVPVATVVTRVGTTGGYVDTSSVRVVVGYSGGVTRVTRVYVVVASVDIAGDGDTGAGCMGAVVVICYYAADCDADCCVVGVVCCVGVGVVVVGVGVYGCCFGWCLWCR